MVFVGLKLWKKINEHPELTILEKDGFVLGERKGKTMDVPLETIWKSFEKQVKDLQKARLRGSKEHIKQCLADVRNVAGCLFLKLQETTE